jgi:nicotinate-nucleotide adenylyltransferase
VTLKRIGIYGGTFDPIHIAHLVLAERAREQLELDRVLFLPAALPPHKQDRGISDGKRRLEMVEIAVAGNPNFEASPLELNRIGVSYTIDTLHDLGKEYPGVELVLLVGADMLEDIPNWRLPDEIIQLAKIGYAERPGVAISHPLPPSRVCRIEMAQMDVSSTDIRSRVRDGQSIRYVVPAGVEAYIHAHSLYRSPELPR